MNIKLKIKILEKFGTQADFAMAVKAHESDVSRVMRERRTITPESQKIWAAALDCDPQEIFGSQASEVQNETRTG